MKTAVLISCFWVFCGVACFGQASLSGQTQAIVIPDHPQHAGQHEMARAQDIYEHSDYAYAQGERPLYEFGPISHPVPLGDVARGLRKEHALVKKADIIWEN